MAAPSERLPEPRGTRLNGKIGKLRTEFGIVWIPGSSLRFLSASPIHGGFVYIAFPRWVLGVDGRPFGTPPRNPAERHGTVKLGNYA